jgi:hypothetical protein
MEKIFQLLIITLQFKSLEIQFFFRIQALDKKNIFGLKEVDIAELQPIFTVN